MRAAELRWLAIVMALVVAVAIPFVDLRLAHAIHGSAFADDRILQDGTLLLDWITGKEIWRYLLAVLLLAPGLVLMAIPARRRLGAKLVFVGGVHGLASLVVVLAKPIFGRVRPEELITTHADPMWFVGGSSFPSGHTAFYFGLFLPLAWLFPRYLFAWLTVPVFIALARINTNDHYLGDVCTSILLCCLLTLLFARLLRPWLPEGERES